MKNTTTLTIEGYKLWVGWAFSGKGLSMMEFGVGQPVHSHLESLKEATEAHPGEWDKDMLVWLKDFEKKKFSPFPLPLDLDLIPPFHQDVVMALMKKVPAGKTVSYQGLAKLAGRPLAHRAVGTTMATHPYALVVPCHRVLHSQGTTTCYGKGVFYKWLFLKHENADLPEVESMKKRYGHEFPVS